MPRLSRAKKREQKHAAAAQVAAPIDVHVPVAGPGAGGASIGGVPVMAAPGEEIQHVVLAHLQRIARAGGHPVHATVHDERIGYVVPLLVEEDGSSRFTAEPVRTGPPAAQAIAVAPAAERPALPAPPPSTDPTPTAGGAGSPAPSAEPHHDKPTHVLRPLPGPSQDASPTYRLRALPEPVQDAAPGTVAPPLGEFGPPPVMDAPLNPTPTPTPTPTQGPEARPEPDDAPPPQPSTRIPVSDPTPLPVPTPAAKTAPGPDPHPRPHPHSHVHPDPASDPDPKPAPPRGFDAVAEAVLGDPQGGATADASAFAVSMARINDAVAAGRTAEAAELAERTVAEASAVLGPQHAEVLRIRELGAYIAYLAGEPERAFALALDVARRHRSARDAEAAYGSLHGAATAWRAVRDPAQGLHMGRDLLGLWDELAAEGGPAADDVEELEAARARMDRLAARAAKSTEPPTG
ncbi:tetratricopeptide repeat protein [Streptomyces sp. Tu102]|uniref:tetratricopeptide repeat protein n=1 Tax=Streptomyces sp. Tu102 TaxID=2838019 RepID=UPI001BDCDB36|nr:tetratricopeptide repeat protein [Streptomyces sp. Tu102]MBT1096649.1 tetratricopeptide repeat protein [Streptomyces sp. Tu102]